MAAQGAAPISVDNLDAVVERLASQMSSLSGSVSSLSSRVAAAESAAGVVLYNDSNWASERRTPTTSVTLSQSMANFGWLQVSIAHSEGNTIAVGTTLVPVSGIRSSDRESNGAAYAFTLENGIGPDDAIFVYGSGTKLSIDDQNPDKSIARVVGYK